MATTSNELGSYKLGYSGQEVNERLGLIKNVVSSSGGTATDLYVTGLMTDDKAAVNVGWVNKKLTNYIGLSGTSDSAPILGNIKLAGRVYDLNYNRTVYTDDLLTYGGYPNSTKLSDLSVYGVSTDSDCHTYNSNFVPKNMIESGEEDAIELTGGKKVYTDTENDLFYKLPRYKFANLAFLPTKLLGTPANLLAQVDQNKYAGTGNYGYGITDVYFKDYAATEITKLTTPGFTRVRLGTDTSDNAIERDLAFAANTIRGYNILESDTNIKVNAYTSAVTIAGTTATLLLDDGLSVVKATSDSNAGCISLTYKGSTYALQGHGTSLADFHLSGTVSVTNGIPTGSNPSGAFTQEQTASFFKTLVEGTIAFSGSKTFTNEVAFNGGALISYLEVTGASSLLGAVAVGSTLTTAGAATFSSTVNITGKTTATEIAASSISADSIKVGTSITLAGTTGKISATSVESTFTGNLTGNVTGDVTGNVTGNLTGNASSATKLATSRSLKVNLASTSAQSFDGTAAATSIGVSGTLPITNGGTGKTSFTDNKLIYGQFSQIDLPTATALLQQTAAGAFSWVTATDIVKTEHTHTKSQITDFAHTHTTSEITGLDASLSTLNTSISTINTNITTLQTDVSDLQSAVSTLQTTVPSHTHSASDITSGTLAIARIPTGTTSSTVALGNHTHSNYATTTTVSTLSSTVDTINSNLTSLTTRVSANETNISSAQSNISSLQTEITGITNLKSGSSSAAAAITDYVADKLAEVGGTDENVKQTVSTSGSTFPILAKSTAATTTTTAGTYFSAKVTLQPSTGNIATTGAISAASASITGAVAATGVVTGSSFQTTAGDTIVSYTECTEDEISDLF